MKRRREKGRGVQNIIPSCGYKFFVIGLAALLVLFMTPMIDLQMDQGAWAKGPAGKAVQAGQGSDHETGAGQKGSQGAKKITGKSSGAKDVKDVILADEGEDDSDRPEWAQGNRDLNPHNQGGGQPGEAGSKKGDMYGDLWIIDRDSNGVPVLDDNGFVQPLIELEDGTIIAIQLTEDGELPPEYASLVEEVEFGRLSVGRSPNKVTDHALDEVLAKMSDGTVISFDLAGRVMIDGATIDSPLENLALYVALMTDDPALNPILDVLLAETDKLTLAASLFAAAADKTGSIAIDTVAYQNVILGIAAMTLDDYVDYSEFDYNRDDTYTGDISYYVQKADGTVVLETDTIINAVFDGVSYDSNAGVGIVDFAQAADDALQMIEFVHTTIHLE